LPIAFGALFAIDKFKGSESEKSEKSDWFKMLGGTQKDIDDYKNLVRNYRTTFNSLKGNAKAAFEKDKGMICKELVRSFATVDRKMNNEKYRSILRRILEICALNNNPFRNEGGVQYAQGYSIWCALIIKKFASNNGSIGEDTEAKIYFVYKNIIKALLPVFDKTGHAKGLTDKVYSDLYENFLERNKISKESLPVLMKSVSCRNILLAMQLVGCFSNFLTGDDKLLFVDRVIQNATKNDNFAPEVVLQTMVDKLYEIILEHNDGFLAYCENRKTVSDDSSDKFDVSSYFSTFNQYMTEKIRQAQEHKS